MADEKYVRSCLAALGVYNVANAITSSGYLNASCPFAPYLHETGNDTNPSFGISVDVPQPFFQCFSCHISGSLSGLAFQLANYRKDEKLRKLGRKFERELVLNITRVEYKSWEDRANQFEEKASDDVFTDSDIYNFYPFAYHSVDCRRYLKKRGYGYRDALLTNLRYDPAEGRILFVIRNANNHIVGVSGRSIIGGHPKTRDYLGFRKKHHLYTAPSLIKTFDRLILVEGPFDLLRMRQFGYWNTACLLGNILTPEKTELLKSWKLPVITLLDNDLGGEAGIYGTLNPDNTTRRPNGIVDKLFEHLPIIIPGDYPDDVNDPDNLTKKQFKRMLRKRKLFMKG